ncbi:radical SAM protein [Clostridium felsineum]|uniref:radical SAM protein n=1 Tax=Clostridium felsineum TaxID=36839 RepID=UPI00214DC059|nr:radical SAM protein [Clostridium felsineum]MCR3761612.1 radical SAM protein [Clostridium felsineum]
MGHYRKKAITFFVSNTCNLACKYCYIPKREIIKGSIDIEFARAGLKEFFETTGIYAIRFFSSGEATVQFDKMKEILQEARKLANGNKVQVELQTNGFFNDEVADWVDENVDILWISFDGPPEINDCQRPTVGNKPSSEVVLKNIKRFVSNPKMQFGVRATILPENFDKQVELMEYFRELKIKWVCGAPTYSSPVNEKVHIPTLLNFAKGFVPAFYRAQELGMFYQTHLMYNFDEEVTCNCRSCTTPITPELTTDGYVSCCDWGSFGPEHLPGTLQQCVYGKWDKENKKIIYFEDKIKRIQDRNVDVLGEGDCKGCEYLKNCAGGCIGKVMSVSGDLHKKDPNWCQAVHYLGQHIKRNTGLYPVRHS